MLYGQSLTESASNRLEKRRLLIAHATVVFCPAQDYFIARTRQRHVEEAGFLCEMRIRIASLEQLILAESQRKGNTVATSLHRETPVRQTRQIHNRKLESFAGMNG